MIFLAVINRVKWSQLCESKTKTNQEQNTLEAVQKTARYVGDGSGTVSAGIHTNKIIFHRDSWRQQTGGVADLLLNTRTVSVFVKAA